MAGSVAPLVLSLPVDAKGLAEARSALAAWLQGSGVGGDDVDDVLIAGNEACMNAVEHSGADGATQIDVAARIEDAVLTIEVRDRGRWREPVPGGDRGHGLGLMRTLMDEVEIDRSDGGTHVRMRREVSFGPHEERASKPAAVTIGQVGGVTVAIIEGEVDLAAVELIEAGLEPAAGLDVSSLVVDLTDVSYLDSSGVHLFFKLANRRHAVGGATRIAVAPGPVRRVLELTGMEATIGLDESVDEAIGRF